MLGNNAIRNIEEDVHALESALFSEAQANKTHDLIKTKIRRPEDKMLAYRSLYEDLAYAAAKGKMKAKAIKNVTGTHYEIIPPDKFLLDSRYLGKRGEVYPEVLREYCEMNSGKYDEVVLTGGIGSAKSTLAIWSIAYQLYLLAALKYPHAVFGLERASEILFVFQSLNLTLAREVDYDRFKHTIKESEFFNRYFDFDKGIDSMLKFPNRIIVKPVSGSDKAAIGQNVFGGMIDEVNYMSITQNSKNSIDGGDYDQAIALYNSIARRRESRFMKKGVLPGLLCLVSSKRFPGQFTDVKEAERKRQIDSTGSSKIYVYDKRTWEIKPEGTYSGEWFHVFIGNESKKPLILTPEEVSEYAPSMILAVPLEYRPAFETDLLNALREIGGVSTLALHPFIIDVDKVTEAFNRHRSILSRESCDFVSTKLEYYPSRFVDPEIPRWVHIDLSISHDPTGVAIAHVPKFVQTLGGELLPQIRYDALLQVLPPRNGEIDFARIRNMLYSMRDDGLNIKWVSFDSYQSQDSIQQMRKKGFMTGKISMDSDSKAYSCLKYAFYSDRVLAPTHDIARKELVSIEYDSKKGKVDHPSGGTKDVADAMAGTCFGLTMSRAVWAYHGISFRDAAQTLIEDSKKLETSWSKHSVNVEEHEDN